MGAPRLTVLITAALGLLVSVQAQSPGPTTTGPVVDARFERVASAAEPIRRTTSRPTS